MAVNRLLFSLLFPFALACGEVRVGSDGGGGDSDGDHRDGGGDPVVTDASGPDATPVDCIRPEDCANPDDPCLLPGTCEDNVCHFPQKDCSDLDGECTRGVCADDGECEARPIRQDMACGDGIMDCGGFGACGDFASTCDESGTQGRSCTDSTCQAGACVTGEPYVDTRTCQRDTDGVTCADSTTSCASCAYSSTCDRSAPPVSCTRTDHACASESCLSTAVSLPDQACERDTECRICLLPTGPTGACSATGGCVSSCQ
jgi:hypothetical protein